MGNAPCSATRSDPGQPTQTESMFDMWKCFSLGRKATMKRDGGRKDVDPLGTMSTKPTETPEHLGRNTYQFGTTAVPSSSENVVRRNVVAGGGGGDDSHNHMESLFSLWSSFGEASSLVRGQSVGPEASVTMRSGKMTTTTTTTTQMETEQTGYTSSAMQWSDSGDVSMMSTTTTPMDEG